MLVLSRLMWPLRVLARRRDGNREVALSRGEAMPRFAASERVRVIATRCSFSRALSPEGCQRAKERGRQTTAILGNNPAVFRRPRAAAAVPRVQRHRQRAFGPTRRVLAAGLSSFGTSGGCAAQTRLRRCAKGVRAVCSTSARRAISWSTECSASSSRTAAGTARRHRASDPRSTRRSAFSKGCSHTRKRRGPRPR